MNFDPMNIFGKSMETWTKLTEESTSRVSAFWSEMEKADTTRVERATSAIDEVARLQKEALSYGAKMNAEMRKIALEAIKQMASFGANASSAAATPAA